MIVRPTALVFAALALSACSSDPAVTNDSGTTPADTGAVDAGNPVDVGTDAGNPVTDTGPADVGTIDAGPPTCGREGGEACFELPTAAVMVSGGAGMPMIAPDFACDLPPVTTTTAALPISGTVGDFVTDDSVAGATVDVFAGLNYQGAPLATATTNAMGEYALMVPSGTTGPLSWRVRAPGTLDTYLVNDTINLTLPSVTRSNRNSVDNGTASLLATLLGQSRRMGTGIIAGNATDCMGRNIVGAVATISSTSSRMTNNRPTFVPSAQIYYFSPSPALPARRTAFSSTSSNGLYLALQLPPSAAATYYAQVWGFRTTAAVAMGAAGLSLLSEVAVKVPPDVLITVNHEPLRAP